MQIFKTTLAFIIIYFLLILFTTRVSADAQEANIIPNQSFENGVNFPTSWQINESEKFCNMNVNPILHDVDWSQTFSATGSKSIGLANISAPRTQASFARVTSEFINISPDQTYEIDFSSKVTLDSKSLLPLIYVCFYNNQNQPINFIWYTPQTATNRGFWTDGLHPDLDEAITPPNASKVRFGLSIKCGPNDSISPDPTSCNGSIYFDDIYFYPIGNIKTHLFDDLNKDKVQNVDEQNLVHWEIGFYTSSNCTGTPRSPGFTDLNGNIVLKEHPFGNYSVKQTFIKYVGPPNFMEDMKNAGWTGEICKNVLLNSGEAAVEFANYQETFPYFSQRDEQWKNDEYDSANKLGPYFCGTTMEQCGCATTSAAMILKYHGATKSPTGEETNPQALNNWLKENNGYAFGAIKWNSVAAYSTAANATFQTQKIKFSGVGAGNNFENLDHDLEANIPNILEEPGHFVVASNKIGTAYQIQDPFSQNNTTLEVNNYKCKSCFENLHFLF